MESDSLERILTIVEQYIDYVSDTLWAGLLYVLVGTGIYFTLRTGFVQCRLFAYTWRTLVFSNKSTKHGVSTFGSFTTALGNKVGTGNIVGIAIALSTGGPGAIFWMWVLAFFAMASAFAESTLAQLYKVRTGEGRFRGGPAYYIERALGIRWLGVFFSFCLVFTLGLVFNAVQTNSIANGFVEAFGFGEKHIIGLVIMGIVAVIIFRGLHTVSKVTTYLVPFMALVYILMAVSIIVMNIDKIPSVLTSIVQGAFGIEPVLGGVAGYTFMQTLLIGAQRGLFSNEAGMGTSPNIAATTNEKHPAVQGLVQMVGIFVDTMVVCTATACIILLSGVYDSSMGIQGAELTQRAVEMQFGSIGKYIITLILFLFAFTSILGNYAFAEDNISFIKKGRLPVIIFRILVLGMIVFGSIGSVPLVWKLSNLASAFMTGINLIVILVLGKYVIGTLKDFSKQRKEGKKEPHFSVHRLHHSLQKGLEDSVWK